jgi:hypothetical protein
MCVDNGECFSQDIWASLASPVRARPVSVNMAEVIMSRHEAARGAGLMDLFAKAVTGIFPGPVLEALIARLEVRQ